MSNWLYRLGRFSASQRRWVVAAWILLAFFVVVVDRTGGGGTVDNFEIPGVESQQAVDL
jgi:RND superfamily putative drug exporter